MKKFEYINKVANDLIKAMKTAGTDFMLPWIKTGMPKNLGRIKSKDPDSGFRIYKKYLIKKILKEQIFNKHLLNSEFTIKSIKHGASYKEVNIDYYQRKGPSRGLPLSIIPNVIFSTIKNSFKIKKQEKSYED